MHFFISSMEARIVADHIVQYSYRLQIHMACRIAEYIREGRSESNVRVQVDIILVEAPALNGALTHVLSEKVSIPSVLVVYQVLGWSVGEHAGMKVKPLDASLRSGVQRTVKLIPSASTLILLFLSRY